MAYGLFNGANSVCGLDGTEVIANAGTNNSTGLTIGAAGDNTSPITGNIAEVIDILGTPDELKRRLVRRYLDAKYNL